MNILHLQIFPCGNDLGQDGYPVGEGAEPAPPETRGQVLPQAIGQYQGLRSTLPVPS